VYDGSTVHGYMRYVNHASDSPNAEFYHTEDSPYDLLRLTRPIHANEEITADYGDAYPYQARGFSQ
jgi:SET domain-containing protein